MATKNVKFDSLKNQALNLKTDKLKGLFEVCKARCAALGVDYTRHSPLGPGRRGGSDVVNMRNAINWVNSIEADDKRAVNRLGQLTATLATRFPA